MNTQHATRNTLTILILMLFYSSFTWGQTPIDNSYFSTNQPNYIWDMGGSPYLIGEDIQILVGSNLIIEPGVEVLFQGHFYMDVKGSINAIGNSNDRIIFTSEMVGEPWNGIRFDFSDGEPPTPSKLYYCDISGAEKTGTTCTASDPESSGGAIYVESFSNLEIYECEIFSNSVLAHGGAIGIFESSNPLIQNNSIHNNFAKKRGGGIGVFISSDTDIFYNNIY